MSKRADLLREIAEDPAAGPGSSPYILASSLTERLQPTAVAAVTANMAARLTPEVPAEEVYNALLYLAAAARLFEVVFSIRDELNLRVVIPTQRVRNHLAHDQPLINPATGEEIGMHEVEVTFRGTDRLRGMLG
jgi:hypothetical protein